MNESIVLGLTPYEPSGVGTAIAVVVLLAPFFVTIALGVYKGRPFLGLVLAILCAPAGLLGLLFVSNKRKLSAIDPHGSAGTLNASSRRIQCPRCEFFVEPSNNPLVLCLSCGATFDQHTGVVTSLSVATPSARMRRSNDNIDLEELRRRAAAASRPRLPVSRPVNPSNSGDGIRRTDTQGPAGQPSDDIDLEELRRRLRNHR